MSRFRQSLGMILLLTVLLTGVTPGVSVCEEAEHPENDSCCTPNPAAEETKTTDTNVPAPCEDCGTTGCGDCTFPCCAPHALVLVQLPSCHVLSPMQADLVPQVTECPWTDADPEFRPPKA